MKILLVGGVDPIDRWGQERKKRKKRNVKKVIDV